MTPTKKKTDRPRSRKVGLWLPEPLIAALDAHAAQMGRETPGLTFSRADAVRVLLTSALAEVEATDKSRRKP